MGKIEKITKEEIRENQGGFTVGGVALSDDELKQVSGGSGTCPTCGGSMYEFNGLKICGKCGHAQ